MRHVLVLAIALSFFIAPHAAPAQTAVRPAPADEYFGRYNESVLEIRNRLNAFDAKSDADATVPGAVEGLDNLADAVLAWKNKYPGDPWISAAMSHMLKCYARTGFASSPRATSILSALLAAYPNAAETREALIAVGKAMLPAAGEAAPEATVAGEVVDAATGSPVAGAVVVIAPDKESTDVTVEPFATTAGDGSFVVKDVPLGSALKTDSIELAHAEYIVVEPPSGSAYAPYHGMVDASDGRVAAGTIRLAAR